MDMQHCWNAQEAIKSYAWRLAFLQGAPLVNGSEQHPVVLFSHGISGIRTSYSGICTELSSAVQPCSTHHSKQLCRLCKSSACSSPHRAVSGYPDASLAPNMPP